MATTSIIVFILTRCHAPPAFFPSPCPAHPSGSLESGPAGRLEDRMGPRDLTRTRPGATLAWMTVGTTRSHQQAAGTKYRRGSEGCGQSLGKHS